MTLTYTIEMMKNNKKAWKTIEYNGVSVDLDNQGSFGFDFTINGERHIGSGYHTREGLESAYKLQIDYLLRIKNDKHN